MIGTAAAGGAALLASTAGATPSHARRYASTLKFRASGQVLRGFDDVITNEVLVIPPLPPTAQFWVDMQLQSVQDVIDVYVYVKIPQGSLDPMVIPVSLIEVGVEDVKLAATAEGWTNFGMQGLVTRVEFTPFPNFEGYPAAIGGRFRDGTIEMLAANVFGSHVTVVRHANGLLEAKLPHSAY